MSESKDIQGPAGNAVSLALRGRVLPLAHALEQAEVVTFAGDRVAAVGSGQLLEDGIRVFDAGDRTILPGFVDSHAHVEVACVAGSTTVDCRAPACGSIADVLEKLRENLDMAESGWLMGRANFFIDQKLAEHRMPTREELDSVSRDVAIALRAGGHTTSLNSKALELVDVKRFQGGKGMMGDAVVEVDESGEPTGVVGELDRAMPLPDPDQPTLEAWLRQEIPQVFTRFGVTSIGEISETLDGQRAMSALAGRGALPARISSYLWTPGTFAYEDLPNWRGSGLEEVEEWFEVQGVKLFADGGYTSRNAATKSPYLATGGYGQLSLTPEEVRAARKLCDSLGLQLAIHTNGERSQELVCDALAELGLGADARPTRLEHAGNLVTEAKTMESWDRAPVTIVPQVVFLYAIGDFLPSYLGEHAERGRFPFRTLIERGWKLNGSSDVHLGSEAELTNPFFGIWNAVTRTGYLGNPIEPDQRLTLDEALRMYTLGSAEALEVVDRRGSLEPGKLADAIVLDRNLLTVAEDDLRDVKVDHVFVGGELAYSRDGAPSL